MFTAAGKSAAASAANYIEDVFSTYLYAGAAGDSTITNGIDLSGKGGLVWIKARTQVGGVDQSHALFDTARGATKFLKSNDSAVETTEAQSLKSFTSTGFTLGGRQEVNGNAANYVSWTFREQAKFFDVVTYTGNGVSNRTIAHNLGSVPGCIIVKRLSGASDGWAVWHRGLSANNVVELNLDAAQTALYSTWFGSNLPTSTVFNLGTDTRTNGNGSTYVAYLFAHNAGGFGAAGTDNVISCGSFTGGAFADINLGYEPQWLLIKLTTGSEDWYVVDSQRGWTSLGSNGYLRPNLSGAELAVTNNIRLTSTGFTNSGATTGTYIYIAIRRGPMKTPTSGASVFTPIKTGSGATLSDSYSSIGFPVDMTLRYQTGTDTLAAYKNAVYTRLLGINSGTADTPTSLNNPNLLTHSTAATVTTWYYSQTGSMSLDYGGSWNSPSYVLTHLHFRRSPGFFDVVCYTGAGNNTTVSHNLGVVPELCIFKRRDTTADWLVHAPIVGANSALYLNLTAANATISGLVTLTSNLITFPTAGVQTSATGGTYVAYLFATVTGVSKVGSYTGTGALQTINCGFAAGARFVLIKRTDSTGDWWVYDSARGITGGNDPYLFLNSTAAEVTNTNYVDTASTGFQVTAAAPAGLNANGGTYIFLAIA